MSILFLAHRLRGSTLPVLRHVPLQFPSSTQRTIRAASLNSAINKSLRRSSAGSRDRKPYSPADRSRPAKEQPLYGRNRDAPQPPDRWKGRGIENRLANRRNREKGDNRDEDEVKPKRGIREEERPRRKTRAERRAEIFPIKAVELREPREIGRNREAGIEENDEDDDDDWGETKTYGGEKRGFRTERSGHGPRRASFERDEEDFGGGRSRYQATGNRDTGRFGYRPGRDREHPYSTSRLGSNRDERAAPSRYSRDREERKSTTRSEYGRRDARNRRTSFDRDQDSRNNLEKRERDDRPNRFSGTSRRAFEAHDEGEDTSATNQLDFSSIDRTIPLSVPYTTPASEFLYGTSVVKAALSSDLPVRRKLYKFYIYDSENRKDFARDAQLLKLALENDVEVVRVSGDFIRVMDKMSSGRPHNGYILEASPLPRLPIRSLGKADMESDEPGFNVVPDTQTREEAVINGSHSFISLPSPQSNRKPLVLLLDCIEDPGNLGGIIRTASFLGVSAIAISVHGSANITPIVLKASAGAFESMTLFSVAKPAEFVRGSKRSGWKIFAAVPPGNGKAGESIPVHEVRDPMRERPGLLMLGGEGGGLRKNLREKADVEVYIPGGDKETGVDSLNVSVAAGVLCEAFMRAGNGGGAKSEDGGENPPRKPDLF